ncbi:MAG: PSD1 and planctomycete cytochrome C domain-containing protein [Gemmatales bacterium]|nr:PSD1 and planctomycete cytochrome C domain-containing protein [Gemmatales bacterium]MDW8387485.1 PSD1 and planctomycete cytochrome C domain-containing protein [Gemmatales bacterium]
MSQRFGAALLALVGWLAAASAQEATVKPSFAPEAIEHFEKRVRPVLIEKCFDCHGPKQQKASLRLDSRQAVLKGSDTQIVVVPGQPEKSLLIEAIKQTGELKMPPKGKLSEEDIAAIEQWIRDGLAWPEDTPPADLEAARKHWAFQPVRVVHPPSGKSLEALANPIDAFILARLESEGLQPAPSADRRTLIRRLYFDLLGLPPEPDAIAAFLEDDDPAAYERLVDRLLASPHFGERWGRHWLDVARYANERGYVGVNVDRTYPFAYAYRDWVIRAFNEDRSYKDFILLQLAADQIVTGPDKRDLAAMGFLTVGRRFINNQQEIIDDRLDVTFRGFQGLTISCARCHDHKYDPIPTKDYYSLYGVFASSQEPDELPILEPVQRGPQTEAFERELRRLEEEKARFERENEAMKRERPREFSEKIKPFENRIKQLHATHPGAPPRGMVLLDAPKPTEPRVFIRGNARNPGPGVPRQFLEILSPQGRKPFTSGSGRLEMAQAIASESNPLTARVFVNRVWGHLFGRGLVRTPSDFGTRGEPPTHPELLDYLAARFMEEGWSPKRLIRLIVLSRTYQQSCEGDADGYRKDPENRLLSRMNRRRLELEPMRDAMLAVAGDLDPSFGGQAVDFLKNGRSTRRTIYGFIDRQNLPGMYRIFDFASPDTHSPKRYETTVPQQALFLMNSPFVIERARKLAARLDAEELTEPRLRIRRLYHLVYGRDPRSEEVDKALAFLEAAEADRSESQLSPWEQYAQVLLMSNEFVFVE